MSAHGGMNLEPPGGPCGDACRHAPTHVTWERCKWCGARLAVLDCLTLGAPIAAVCPVCDGGLTRGLIAKYSGGT